MWVTDARDGGFPTAARTNYAYRIRQRLLTANIRANTGDTLGIRRVSRSLGALPPSPIVYAPIDLYSGLPET